MVSDLPANAPARLTKVRVESAPLRERQYSLWCSDLPGFGAFINPAGSRSYFVDYRTEAGERRRMGLGRHGAVTADGARKLALAALGDVARGGDPAGQRKAARLAETMSELCTAYLKAAENGLVLGKGGRAKKPSTLYTDRGRIEGHILPLLGSKRVRDVTTADINRFIRDVASGKTAAERRTSKLRGKSLVRGGIGTASRTAGLLGGILTFAKAEGIIDVNPSVGVRRPADNVRHRRLSAEEYARLGKALTDLSILTELKQPYDAVWLLALTGCRAGEITRLQWSEVDFKSSCLRLMDSKEGASIRPIGGLVLDQLCRLRQTSENQYVLPPVRSGGSYGGLPNAWRRIIDHACLVGVTPHTLRHSFASEAGDLGFADSTIATLLGHAVHTVTSRYVHRLDAVLVKAADTVAQQVARMMRGG